jgi:glycosyltransferase involved in cell wall biosynthesis
MKRLKPLSTKPKPFLSLCVIFRDNLLTINKLLDSVKDHFDEFVFTDTGSEDGTRQAIEQFATTTPGKVIINDFVWCDDFAKARQFNFEAASGKWRMFLDSDDVLCPALNMRQIVSNIESRHPQIRGLFVPYDYDNLEELDTMRLVRWGNSGWQWTDAIHERLSSTVPLPDGSFGNLNAKELYVKHKRKSQAEKDTALRRNAAIAIREYEATDDAEYKARLARTIAMVHKLDGNIDAAEPYLKEVAAAYGHIPEGHQAWADLSHFEVSRGNLQTALAYAKNAGPSYEALVLHKMQDYKKCIQAATKASVAGQQTTHEGFLFEKVFAYVAMAHAAFELGYHPSEIENALNLVRSDLRMHKVVAPAVSTIRRAIDRITILVPGTPQPFDGHPESTEAMLGGSEEAVVYLTRALATLGRNVRVYGVLPPLSLPGFDRYGVEWRPFSDFSLHAENGTVVVWRAIPVLKSLLEHRSAIAEAIKKGNDQAIEPSGIGASSLWLHDCALGVNNPALAQAILQGVTSVVVLSDHHKRCIERELPADHKVNFVNLSNGIVGDDFKDRSDWPKRDPNRVVYSSCPSRGLVPLLQMWPEIKAACPEAYLDIYYDWSMLQRFQPDEYARVVAAYDAVKHLDVMHHGGVGHADLHAALRGANVWAYSHFDNTDVETFCVSSIKAQAAGCHVITTRHGALPEVVPIATFCDRAEYAQAVIEAIKQPMTDMEREAIADSVLERFDWLKVAERFSQIWTVVRPERVATVTPTQEVAHAE